MKNKIQTSMRPNISTLSGFIIGALLSVLLLLQNTLWLIIVVSIGLLILAIYQSKHIHMIFSQSERDQKNRAAPKKLAGLITRLQIWKNINYKSIKFDDANIDEKLNSDELEIPLKEPKTLVLQIKQDANVEKINNNTITVSRNKPITIIWSKTSDDTLITDNKPNTMLHYKRSPLPQDKQNTKTVIISKNEPITILLTETNNNTLIIDDKPSTFFHSKPPSPRDKQNTKAGVVALPIGLRLANYKILEVLGHGGFGITYLALDTDLRLLVAIKEYFPSEFAVRMQDYNVAAKTKTDMDNYTWGLHNFLKESKILALLDHSNVVKSNHFFEHYSTAYCVMEYVSGRTLAEILHKDDRQDFTEEDVKQLLFPLISALKAIHKKNIIHLDIKPSNIYIRDIDNQPILLDFGAAKKSILNYAQEKSRSISSILTPGYAPVEQYQSSLKNIGPWTDIYSLACTMYRVITGEIPTDAFSRYTKLVDNEIDPLLSLYEKSNNRFSQSLLDAIMYGLNIEKDKRPQSALEWEAAFSKMPDNIHFNKKMKQKTSIYNKYISWLSQLFKN